VVESTITTTTQVITTTPLSTSTTALPEGTIQTFVHYFELWILSKLYLVCGGYYNEPNGVIASPKYPDPYGYNETCEYVIQLAKGNRVALNFLYFETESGADYVTVL
jgi:hypothetical protein